MRLLGAGEKQRYKSDHCYKHEFVRCARKLCTRTASQIETSSSSRAIARMWPAATASTPARFPAHATHEFMHQDTGSHGSSCVTCSHCTCSRGRRTSCVTSSLGAQGAGALLKATMQLPHTAYLSHVCVTRVRGMCAWHVCVTCAPAMQVPQCVHIPRAPVAASLHAAEQPRRSATVAQAAHEHVMRLQGCVRHWHECVTLGAVGGVVHGLRALAAVFVKPHLWLL